MISDPNIYILIAALVLAVAFGIAFDLFYIAFEFISGIVEQWLNL